ncbi:Coenzyme F420 hydrogenase/dehydrogenase, beta subunit C-terminal domain [Desulfonatronum thioautotrophicum]|uniref:Coenzyme F420 hydrogenase/dehydrogenase, beta subunit C-terminal domain n=1 Tax=Desulfonatronum thioautotrophicum TaxID=617001 RepID=UPI000A00F7EF|nr:Coenzyme F420 hydrogenase/dehydrogenase, beta subunit C-terminal domain [Desulfonatronum thioautotrophicum]
MKTQKQVGITGQERMVGGRNGILWSSRQGVDTHGRYQGHSRSGNGGTGQKGKPVPNAFPGKSFGFHEIDYREFFSESQNQGFCRRCGGCVTYCSAMNNNALAMAEDGYPRITDRSCCTQCGLCYQICSANDDCDGHIKEMLSWEEPSGRVLGVGLFRARDEHLRQNGTNGGALTALLIHMLDMGSVIGVFVPGMAPERNQMPLMVRNRKEILENSSILMNPGLGSLLYTKNSKLSDDAYNDDVNVNNLHVSDKFCFVGRGCQINSLRKMEYFGVMPSEFFELKIGVFCNHDNLEDKNLPGCNFCNDQYAQYADISVSDYNVKNDYSAIMARTSLGLMYLSSAAKNELEHTKGLSL